MLDCGERRMVGCFRSKEKCGGAAARDPKKRRRATPINCVDRSTGVAFGISVREHRKLAILSRRRIA